jgi:hypothetical protein
MATADQFLDFADGLAERWRDVQRSARVLTQREQYFQHLFDYAPAGYIVTDCLDTILDANRTRHAAAGGTPVEFRVTVQAIRSERSRRLKLYWLLRDASAQDEADLV